MSKNNRTKRKIVRKIILIALVLVFVLFAVIVGWSLFVERPAVQTMADYQNAYSDAVITLADDGSVEIFPESGEADTGMVFYVGAQITPDAYIPLLARIAEQGYACFVPSLHFNMASLEPNAADDIISAHPEIKSWVFAGHSIGGYTIAGYVDDHREIADGLILLAAYTNHDLHDADLPVLSVFGDADGVMNKTRYEKGKALLPDGFEEQIIPGANHAQYGDYGKQPRDNDAKISAEQQQSKTAEIILDWLSRHTADGKSAASED